MTATMVGVDWGMLALGINTTPREARETVVRAEGLMARYGEHAVVRNLSVEICRDEVVGALAPLNWVKRTTIGLVPSLSGSVDLFDLTVEPRTDGQTHAATLIDTPASDQGLSRPDTLRTLVRLRPGATTTLVNYVPEITSLIDCGGMYCIMSSEHQLDHSTRILSAAEVA